MENNNRITVPNDFDYDRLIPMFADDFLRNGCKREAVDYLFDMGSEMIEHDPVIDNVWYAGQPTGMTLAEFIQDANDYDFSDM